MSRVKKIGEAVLRQKTLPVTTFDSSLSDLVSQMTIVMQEENGIGLAANQIGISLSVAIVDTDRSGNVKLFVNPEITSASDPIDFEEGCLSIPGVMATTRRFSKLTLRYQDINGVVFEEIFEGLIAIAIQHEVDHLNGKLYVDSLSRLKRDMTMRRYNKVN